MITMDPSSGYHVQCLLVWESEEAWKKIGASPAASGIGEIMGDVKNFTSSSAKTFVATVVGESHY